MRILSKFRDYYDKAMGLGVDRSLVFVRNKKESDVLDPKKCPRLVEAYDTMPYHRSLCEPFLILFCGKVYPAWRIPGCGTQPYNKHQYLKEIPDVTVFSIKEWAKKITQNRLNREWGKSPKKATFIKNAMEYKRYSRSKKARYGIKEEDVWRDEFRAAFTNVDELHVEHQSPILVLRSQRLGDSLDRIEVNPQLELLGFAKIFDPYSAFQEISQYIGGGPLAQQKDTISKLTDELMRDSKGF